ncbi:MAG TPA: hypothetical protein VK474_00880, partial [Chthoniobacterales bacterium]|nr:hypothetical protein [Chthoniobacterales bacterium]
VAAPEVAAPEVAAPEVAAPEVAAPEAAAPVDESSDEPAEEGGISVEQTIEPLAASTEEEVAPERAQDSDITQ